MFLYRSLPDTYLGSHSFNVSDLTPFSTGVANLWTKSLPPGEHDEDMRDSAPIEPAQPSIRMTRSMTQDLGLGQDPPLASASEPIIPKRITRSRAQALGVEHHLVYF